MASTQSSQGSHSEVEKHLKDDVVSWTTSQILNRTEIVQDQILVVKNHIALIQKDIVKHKEKINANTAQIYQNTKLPHLVGHLVEMLTVKEESEDKEIRDEEREEGRNCPIIKTSIGTRATYFLPFLQESVNPKELKPNDLLAINKDTYTIIALLPQEYDARVVAMEVTERPTEKFCDIGGLGKEAQELMDAVVIPLTRKDLFQKIGITPPRGVLLYGPPGTGKTLMARATAEITKATFLRLAGTQLVQMFIGEGAKLVRDAFEVAKRKAPAVLFIDEIDSIGKKRSSADSDSTGSREVQRTLMELLNQLDGFQPFEDIKVIAATNRVDILDPALIRSGRLDRKIELPLPDLEGRAQIMKIHSRKMKTRDVNFDELAHCTSDFNGAQLRAVCVEAGMIALRRNAVQVTHNDFMDGVMEVQEKKKTKHFYYA